jgi:hypothetical protein
MPLSSSGLGYRPLTAETGVRVPVGVWTHERGPGSGPGLARLVGRSLSSAGRAPRSHRGCRRFESCSDHIFRPRPTSGKRWKWAGLNNHRAGVTNCWGWIRPTSISGMKPWKAW